MLEMEQKTDGWPKSGYRFSTSLLWEKKKKRWYTSRKRCNRTQRRAMLFRVLLDLNLHHASFRRFAEHV